MKPLHRSFAVLGAILLSQAAFAGETVNWWLTLPDKSALLAGQEATLNFTAPAAGATAAIVVDAGKQYQSIDGFGFALTGGSADHLMNPPAADRKGLLEELLSAQQRGTGIS